MALVGPNQPPRPEGRAEGVEGGGGVGLVSTSRPRRRRRSLGLPADPSPRPPPPRPTRGTGTGGIGPPPHPTTSEAHTPGFGGGAMGRPPQPQAGVAAQAGAVAAGGGGESPALPPSAVPDRRPARLARAPEVRALRRAGGDPAGRACGGPGPAVLRTPTLGWWVGSTAARGFASCASPVGSTSRRTNAPGLGRWLPPRLLSFCAFDPTSGWTTRKFNS